MTAEEFRDLGERIYRSPRWQAAMSRHFSISDRTIRRYAAGKNDIPEWLIAELVLIEASMRSGSEMLDRALAIASEFDVEWAAIREGRIVWLVHNGAAVGVGLWSDDRGIISPRLLADQKLLDDLSESVRVARERHS